jgi:hypothetical protein
VIIQRIFKNPTILFFDFYFLKTQKNRKTNKLFSILQTCSSIKANGKGIMRVRRSCHRAVTFSALVLIDEDIK